MNDRCAHGELDAVCRLCADPLGVDDASWEIEWWTYQQRRRWLRVAAVVGIVLLIAVAGRVAR